MLESILVLAAISDYLSSYLVDNRKAALSHTAATWLISKLATRRPCCQCQCVCAAVFALPHRRPGIFALELSGINR